MSVAVSAWTDSLLCALGSRKRTSEIVFSDSQGRSGKYVGETCDGKANGFGKWSCSSDAAPYCEGDFVENQLHGHATKTWRAGPWAGNRYTGGFRSNKKHGVGTYSWANGDSYHGIWRDGPRHGAGVFVTRAGVEERRVYENGAPVTVNGAPAERTAPPSPLTPRRVY